MARILRWSFSIRSPPLLKAYFYLENYFYIKYVLLLLKIVSNLLKSPQPNLLIIISFYILLASTVGSDAFWSVLLGSRSMATWKSSKQHTVTYWRYNPKAESPLLVRVDIPWCGNGDGVAVSNLNMGRKNNELTNRFWLVGFGRLSHRRPFWRGLWLREEIRFRT